MLLLLRDEFGDQFAVVNPAPMFLAFQVEFKFKDHGQLNRTFALHLLHDWQAATHFEAMTWIGVISAPFWFDLSCDLSARH